MDLKLFKLDIDELISEFAEGESSSFTEFKRVWLSKKFSFIFEASPSTNQDFFMQSLYAFSIGHMVSDGSLPNKLGGLYCLYCLYETQPFKPPYKVYLSLGELRQLKNLAVDAKAMGVKVVAALLKSMLEKNVFLFGAVGVNEGSATERVNELMDVQNARVQAAYKKLLANSRLEHFIHMDMGMELEVDLFKKRSAEYAAAKELAIKGASQVIDVDDIKHIAENKKLLGEMVEKDASDWESQKQSFYGKTGLRNLAVAVQNEDPHPQDPSEIRKRKACSDAEGDEKSLEEEEADNFDKELEEALLFQPLECDDDNEEAGPNDDEDI